MSSRVIFNTINTICSVKKILLSVQSWIASVLEIIYYIDISIHLTGMCLNILLSFYRSKCLSCECICYINIRLHALLYEVKAFIIGLYRSVGSCYPLIQQTNIFILTISCRILNFIQAGLRLFCFSTRCEIHPTRIRALYGTKSIIIVSPNNKITLVSNCTVKQRL